MMSWSKRAERRLGAVNAFRPPGDQVNLENWHLIDTPMGRIELSWLRGIERWEDRQGARYAAEAAGEWGWRYVGLAPDQ